MRIDDYHEMQRSQEPQKRERETDKSEETARNSDKIEISRDARHRSDNVDTKLNDVRAKIKDGTYTRPSMAGSVADGIMRSRDLEGSSHMGAEEPDENRNDCDDTEIRQDRVDEVKKKITSGKYSDGEITKIIADRILDRLCTQKPREDEAS